MILWFSFVVGIIISLISVVGSISTDNNLVGKGCAGAVGVLLFLISGSFIFLQEAIERIASLFK
jgi:hypothetical protein